MREDLQVAKVFASFVDTFGVAVGCIIAALCIGVLTTFGIVIIHVFERYSGYLQVFPVLILIGASGRQWDVHLLSFGKSATVTANRCSFSGLVKQPYCHELKRYSI